MRHRAICWVGGVLILLPSVVSGLDGRAVKAAGFQGITTWESPTEGRGSVVTTPSYDGDTGIFRLSRAVVLPKGRAAFSVFRSNEDRDPMGIDASILGVTVAYGAASRLEVFSQVPLQARVKVNGPSGQGFFTELPFAQREGWATGLGDIKIGAKYDLRDRHQGERVSLAVRGLVALDTADGKKGLGAGSTGASADVVISVSLGERSGLHGVAGYHLQRDPSTVHVANAFRWGAGVDLAAGTSWSLQAEVTGRLYGAADYQQTNPIDIILGPVIRVGAGVFLRPAWSYALGYDARGSGGSVGKRSGMHIMIGYEARSSCCEWYSEAPPPRPPANLPPTVSLDCRAETVVSGASTECHATAVDPDGDKLEYLGSSSAGQIEGAGPDGKLDTTGVACATTITVRMLVFDGRGGQASAHRDVRVICAENQTR